MGGSPTTTQTSSPPAWAEPFDVGYSAIANALLTGQPTNIPPMPTAALSSVASLTPAQLQALQGISSTTGPAAALAGNTGNLLNAQLTGQYLNPTTNPYLTATYNEAAQGLVNQYQTATAPTLMAEGEGASGGGPAGAAGNSAIQQAQQLNQYNLGQNLGNLATNIYGGAYEQGVQNQLTAAGLTGAAQSAMYSPYSQLLGAGGVQQQQQQNVLDVATQNALNQANWPISRLSQVAGITQALQSTGGSVTGPNPAQTKL